MYSYMNIATFITLYIEKCYIKPQKNTEKILGKSLFIYVCNAIIFSSEGLGLLGIRASAQLLTALILIGR